MKFGTVIYCTEGLLNLVHLDICDRPRLHYMEIIGTLSLLLMISLLIIGYIL